VQGHVRPELVDDPAREAVELLVGVVAGVPEETSPVHQQGRLADRPVAEQGRVFGLTVPGALDASLEGRRFMLTAGQKRREDPAARSERVRRSRL
jgi:hypothetical protein